MYALREVVKSNSREFSLYLPEWAVGTELEIIIMPVYEEQKRVGMNGCVANLLKKPIVRDSFSPMSREDAHAR